MLQVCIEFTVFNFYWSNKKLNTFLVNKDFVSVHNSVWLIFWGMFFLTYIYNKYIYYKYVFIIRFSLNDPETKLIYLIWYVQYHFTFSSILHFYILTLSLFHIHTCSFLLISVFWLIIISFFLVLFLFAYLRFFIPSLTFFLHFVLYFLNFSPYHFSPDLSLFQYSAFTYKIF